MEPCQLLYIPTRLHASEREPIEVFSIGENLFRRCDPKDLENPFASITLTELSHNRRGNDGYVLCEPNDVLFNIKAENGFETYDNAEVCTLEIIGLNPDGKYIKEFDQIKNGEFITARMELLHDPEPCMFPHCVFRIWIGDVIVTYDNYGDTLDRYKQIRTKIREELAHMMVTKKINQDHYPS